MYKKVGIYRRSGFVSPLQSRTPGHGPVRNFEPWITSRQFSFPAAWQSPVVSGAWPAAPAQPRAFPAPGRSTARFAPSPTLGRAASFAPPATSFAAQPSPPRAYSFQAPRAPPLQRSPVPSMGWPGGLQRRSGPVASTLPVPSFAAQASPPSSRSFASTQSSPFSRTWPAQRTVQPFSPGFPGTFQQRGLRSGPSYGFGQPRPSPSPPMQLAPLAPSPPSTATAPSPLAMPPAAPSAARLAEKTQNFEFTYQPAGLDAVASHDAEGRGRMQFFQRRYEPAASDVAALADQNHLLRCLEMNPSSSGCT